MPNKRQAKRGKGKGPNHEKKNGGKSAVSGMNRNDLTTVVRMAKMPLFTARSKNMMLPYYTATSLTVPATAAAVSFVFSANGLYDPDISGTGTQPTGFDQMMVFYEHYTVLKARVVVTFRNYSGAIAPIVFLAARGDVTNVPSPLDVMTQGNTVSTQLQAAGQFGSLKELTLELDVRRFLGFDDLLDASLTRGDVASNPSEGAFFHVGAFENGVPATGAVYIQVRIEYHAIFTEPRIITPSLALSLGHVIQGGLPPSEVKSGPVVYDYFSNVTGRWIARCVPGVIQGDFRQVLVTDQSRRPQIEADFCIVPNDAETAHSGPTPRTGCGKS